MLNFEIIVDRTDRQNMRWLRFFWDSRSIQFAPDKFHQTILQLSWHTRLSLFRTVLSPAQDMGAHTVHGRIVYAHSVVRLDNFH